MNKIRRICNLLDISAILPSIVVATIHFKLSVMVEPRANEIFQRMFDMAEQPSRCGSLFNKQLSHNADTYNTSSGASFSPIRLRLVFSYYREQHHMGSFHLRLLQTILLAFQATEYNLVSLDMNFTRFQLSN
ncbi:MAG: hypothetical protein M3362_18270 [Acidobacteriota bacterium]|nr:hypothetical protein [Acidobacteriota bacterium]